MNTTRCLFVGSLLLLWCGSAARVCAQEELIDLVTGLLADQDQEVRSLAFNQIRQEIPGEAATRKFAEMLPSFPAETQVGLLSALADRGDSAAASAVRQLLSASHEEKVQVAAIKALGSLGDRNDVKRLVESLTSGSEPIREAARRSLVRLPTEATNSMIDELSESSAATRVALLQILTTRRAREAVPVMLETASSDDDASVRQAAISSLSDLAGAEHVAGMIPLVLEAAPGRERDAVERAIATVCLRQPDELAQAAPLLEAIENLKDSERAILFSTLGRIGGSVALEAVDDAVGSSRPELRDAGIRALCNWPNGTVVARLLGVARTEERVDQRNRAFKALIRIAPLADHRDERRRLDTLRTVFVMCNSDADRKVVLDRAKAIRSIDTLRFVVTFLNQPTLAEQACLTVVELAHHSGLREANKDEFHGVLDQVIQTSKDPTVIDRAERYKTGKTWVRPKN